MPLYTPEHASALAESAASRKPCQESLLSVIVPCKNEAVILPESNRRLVQVLEQLGVRFEVIYVDDGSTDSTLPLLRDLQSADSRLRVVALSRNFGHQLAITAGLQHAAGDVMVVIDADLQDPPEVIAEFVAKWSAGFDVVYGVRQERAGETAFKLWTAKLFYRVINRLSDVEIPLDTGDFRLMDRKVVDAFLAMPERDRFVRGMVSWIGYSQAAVPYRRAARQSGNTKYPLLKMLRLATDGIASFSNVPLRLATVLGFTSSAVAMVFILYALLVRLFTNNWVPGWTTIFIAVLFMGGAQLICLGIIGEYLGRLYGEAKRRPLYLVRERLGFDGSALSAGAPSADEQSADSYQSAQERARTKGHAAAK